LGPLKDVRPFRKNKTLKTIIKEKKKKTLIDYEVHLVWVGIWKINFLQDAISPRLMYKFRTTPKDANRTFRGPGQSLDNCV
jgi:hypothetical protein